MGGIENFKDRGDIHIYFIWTTEQQSNPLPKRISEFQPEDHHNSTRGSKRHLQQTLRLYLH